MSWRRRHTRGQAGEHHGHRDDSWIRGTPGVRERTSIIENLVGLGNVRVARGRGETLKFVVRNIDDATTFASEIRRRLGRNGVD